MKILLTGGTGMLGKAIQKAIPKSVITLAPTRSEMDITDKNSVIRYAKKHQPDLIIHTAAWTDVDGAEANPEACFLVNETGTKNLLSLDLPLAHISTDYVFFDVPNEPITEDTKTSPKGIYSMSKAMAEKAVSNHTNKWWNIRTCGLFGDGKNFVTTIANAAKTQDQLRIVKDQWVRPTAAKEVAKWIATHILQLQIACGHYHVTNQGAPGTWADIAQFICNQTKTKTSIIPILTKDLNRPAPRPQWSILANTKTEQLSDWKEAIALYLNRY